MVLIKEMILPFIKGQAIRIIQPAGPGPKMKNRPFALLDRIASYEFIFSCLIQFVADVICPFHFCSKHPIQVPACTPGYINQQDLLPLFYKEPGLPLSAARGFSFVYFKNVIRYSLLLIKQIQFCLFIEQMDLAHI